MHLDLPAKRYYRIGEIAKAFDVNASLIRFWDKEFEALKPKKNAKGNRRFTPEDVQNLKLIYNLVKERGYTLEGAKTYLKEQNQDIKIIGVQPTEGSAIPGIRRWPKAYLPSIFQPGRVDETIDMEQDIAEDMMRKLAIQEGIFCGVSSGGNVAAALRLSEQVSNALIVAIICDRGDRYLSTGVFPA